LNVFGVLLGWIVMVACLFSGVQAAQRRHLLEWTTDLRLLSAQEFEWVVGEVLRREGWDVQETGREAAADGNVEGKRLQRKARPRRPPRPRTRRTPRQLTRPLSLRANPSTKSRASETPGVRPKRQRWVRFPRTLAQLRKRACANPPRGASTALGNTRLLQVANHGTQLRRARRWCG
jgi:hypothetical protein